MKRTLVPIIAAAALALSAVVAAPATAGPGDRALANATGYYLALGDSLAAGYQPGAGDDRTGGYVGGVLTAIRHDAPKTRLVNVACSGETAVSLVGGGRCSYKEGSQLGAALAFLHSHGTFTRVVTIDIGANDVQRCVAAGAVDMSCIQTGMANVAQLLPAVVARLTAAAPNAQVVVLDYYNPFLTAYLTGPAGQQLAQTSAGLQSALNGIITNATTTNSVTLARISSAFDSTNWAPATLPGVGTVPTNVAMICTYTWMCTKDDIHANDAGYALMARTVAAVLD